MTDAFSTPGCGAEKAQGSLRNDLQAVHRQLFDLHVQGVEAHAHFIGTRFTGMQRHLEDIVQTVREASAAVSELLRGLDGDSAHLVVTNVTSAEPGLRPGERCATAAANMITHRISVLRNTIRRISDDGGADSSTAGLLGAIADVVENQALSLAAESRRINSRADSMVGKDDRAIRISYVNRAIMATPRTETTAQACLRCR